MTHISAGRDVVTLINVFTVSPQDQQRLVKLLVEATEGMISATGLRLGQYPHEPRRHAGNELRPVAQQRRLRGDAGRPRGAGSYAKGPRAGRGPSAALRGSLHAHARLSVRC